MSNPNHLNVQWVFPQVVKKHLPRCKLFLLKIQKKIRDVHFHWLKVSLFIIKIVLDKMIYRGCLKNNIKIRYFDFSHCSFCAHFAVWHLEKWKSFLLCLQRTCRLLQPVRAALSPLASSCSLCPTDMLSGCWNYPPHFVFSCKWPVLILGPVLISACLLHVFPAASVPYSCSAASLLFCWWNVDEPSHCYPSICSQSQPLIIQHLTSKSTVAYRETHLFLSVWLSVCTKLTFFTLQSGAFQTQSR